MLSEMPAHVDAPLDLSRLEAMLRGLLMGPQGNIGIVYNEHTADGLTAAQAIERGVYDEGVWASAEEMAKALRENSVWQVMCFPISADAGWTVFASSLPAAIEAAMQRA